VRRTVFKQKLLHLIGRDVYRSVFDRQRAVFVHVPKAAGTSVAMAVFAADPGHFSADELQSIDRRKFERYIRFAFVRDPVSRMLSTYKYAVAEATANPRSAVRFILRFRGLEDFVQNGLTTELVERHYFFWSQCRYVGAPGMVDFIGKMETIDSDFRKLADKQGWTCTLSHLNRSSSGSASPCPAEIRDIVRSRYREDFERFGYDT
jgi:hypothetical protein